MTFPTKISVLMPTFNTELPMLKESVESILRQTLGDFEFIIIDDGSTNGTEAYLKGLHDPRIKVIRNPVNLGITKSLNKGLKVAKGKYIARMDADDISLPTRLEKQFSFMEKYTDVIVCGTKAENINKYQKWNDGKKKIYSIAGALYRKEDMEYYRIRMLFSNPGPFHPTAFFRHQEMIKHHILYDEELIYAQDYGMWATISNYGTVGLLEEVLLLRRKHENQITTARSPKQSECDKRTQEKLLTALIGKVTKEEIDRHYFYSSGKYQEATINRVIAGWYDHLLDVNERRRIYNQKKLRRHIEIIKTRLIWQTFTKSMTRREKTMLWFQYLPFFSAIKETVKMSLAKVKSIIRHAF